MVQNESWLFGIQSVNSQAIVTKFLLSTIIIYSFGNNPENFAKFHSVFQKLDHLTSFNAILRINRKKVNSFIHVIEERHK